MNRLIITLMLMLFSSIAIFAQEFNGMAVYESKQSLKDMKIESKDINDEMMKGIMERMKKQFEKTYILNFNKYESVYQEEQKLEAPSAGFSMTKLGSSDSEITYKNVKNKLKIAEEEFFGKEFFGNRFVESVQLGIAKRNQENWGLYLL